MQQQHTPNVFKSVLTTCFCAVTLFPFSKAVAQEKQFRKIPGNYEIPGIQAGYVKNGKLKIYKNGLKSAGDTAHVNNTTVFQAASLSKIPAAYAALRLCDRGLLNLDTPLMHYFYYDRISDEPYASEITARMVLTHTTGLPNWQVSVFKPEWLSTKMKLAFKPGTRFRYSGEGFYFLQRAMEQVTKKPFETIMQEEVFTPLGMSFSSYEWQEKYEQLAADGHNKTIAVNKRARFRKPNAAYSLYTNASDYTKFIQQALVEGKGLKPETHALMLSKAGSTERQGKTSKADKYVSSGLAVRRQENENGLAVWHTGSNNGFRCFFMAYPATGESLVCFTNSDNGTKAMEELLELFFGKKQTFWAMKWIQDGQ